MTASYHKRAFAKQRLKDEIITDRWGSWRGVRFAEVKPVRCVGVEGVLPMSLMHPLGLPQAIPMRV
jgi:hypothetical protein